MSDVKRIMDILCEHYTDSQGQPHRLNATQAAFYQSALEKFPGEVLFAVAEKWTKTSRFFPAISDLLSILEPQVDPKTQAAIAWSEVEKLTRQVSGYDHVLFEDPALGECVKRVFGSWTRATSMDQNDPMWAARRNQFMAIYPALLAQNLTEPVRVNGIGGIGRQLVCHEATRPLPQLTDGTPDKSKSVLAEVQRRFLKGRDAVTP